MQAKISKDEKCIVKQCNKPIKVKKHHLCTSHYLRYIRTGDVGGKVRKMVFYKPYKDVMKEKKA